MGWKDLIGMRLDQYEILAELGRGGSSRVYHARDTTLNRDVAVKLIPNDADDRALFISRFAREVEAVQQLHHPNIVAVFGAGENDEFVYLVMQPVSGGTLRQKLSGPLPVPEAASYMVQVAYALQHAHERGIIHRDVKPSNMLLESRDSKHVLLTDFGIAKIQGARGLTKSGTTIGTPEYMSPEQAEGRDIDERSDIYALGCVLYETLAGRPPFLGSTPVSVLFQHVHSRPAYIRGFNPGVPAELVQILEIALAKRPDERYGTAAAFAQALRPFASDLPDISAFQPETGPIVIARSRGLTPTRPLPPVERLTQNDIADRDTIENATPVGQGGIPDETTSQLPAISARATMPPFLRHHHTLPPSRAYRPVPPSRARKTLPPYVRVRRAAPLSALNLSLGSPELNESNEFTPGSTNEVAGPVTPQKPVNTGNVSRRPIKLPLGASPGSSGFVPAAKPLESEPPEPSSRRGATRKKQDTGKNVPPTWPSAHPARKRIAGLIAAAVILALFGGLALNRTALGITFGAKSQPTVANATATSMSTATTQSTATAAPSKTAGPQPTATTTQQQILNQRAYSSFRAVTLATFSDSACSNANSRSTFRSGQSIYVNLCTSGYAVSAPMTVAIRQNGRVVYTMAYGIYISPSSSYFYYTNHPFNSGTYDVLVTLNINGTVAVARDITLTIK